MRPARIPGATAVIVHNRERSLVRDKLKVKELLKLLEADGWILSQTRGSHRQFKHPIKPGLVTFAGKPSSEVPKGTLHAILKQYGLKE